MLQYKQMQVALQTAQNQASLETQLWAEQLMNVHFNLAVLTADPSCDKNFNAPKSETTAVDATVAKQYAHRYSVSSEDLYTNPTPPNKRFRTLTPDSIERRPKRNQ